MLWRFSTVLCVSLLAFSCVGMASASSWYITDLGAPVAGGNSWAYDLTSSGVIVGGGDSTAFTWSNGTMTNLRAPAGFYNATGYGINDAGTVVGTGINISTLQYQGIYYQGGQWYPLAASTYSAQKVYDNGTIVGLSNNGSGGFGTGYVLSGGLGGTYSTQGYAPAGVYAMSPNGTYVGGWVIGSGPSTNGVAAWYNAGSSQYATYPDASQFGTGATGGFYAISSDGSTAVGVEGTGTDEAVVYWITNNSWTNLTNLVTPTGYRGIDQTSTNFGVNDGAYGIDGSTVVGAMTFKLRSGKSWENYSDGVTIPAGQHAIIYNGTTLTDLNSYIASTSGWLLESAQAIVTVGDVPDGNSVNHTGEEWIVGYGLYDGRTQAFLLTPSVYTPTATPEPSTLLLVASGLIGLLAYAWRNGGKCSRGCPSSVCGRGDDKHFPLPLLGEGPRVRASSRAEGSRMTREKLPHS